MLKPASSKSPHLKRRLESQSARLEEVKHNLASAEGEVSALRDLANDLRTRENMQRTDAIRSQHPTSSETTPRTTNGMTSALAESLDVDDSPPDGMSRILNDNLFQEMSASNSIFVRIETGRLKLTEAQEAENDVRRTLKAHEAELSEANKRLDTLRMHIVKYRQMIVETELEEAQAEPSPVTTRSVTDEVDHTPGKGLAQAKSHYYSAEASELYAKEASLQAALKAIEGCLRSKSVLLADIATKEIKLAQLRQEVSDTSDALQASAKAAAAVGTGADTNISAADGAERVKAQLSKASALRRKLLQCSNEMDDTEGQFVQVNALLEAAELKLGSCLREHGYDNWINSSAAAASRADAGQVPTTALKRDLLARAFVRHLESEALALARRAAELESVANHTTMALFLNTGDTVSTPAHSLVATRSAAPTPALVSPTPINLQEALSSATVVVRHARESAEDYRSRLMRRLSALIALEANCLTEIEDKSLDVQLAQEELFVCIRVREEIQLELRLLERMQSDEAALKVSKLDIAPASTATVRTPQAYNDAITASAISKNVEFGESYQELTPMASSLNANSDTDTEEEADMPNWVGESEPNSPAVVTSKITAKPAAALPPLTAVALDPMPAAAPAPQVAVELDPMPAAAPATLTAVVLDTMPAAAPAPQAAVVLDPMPAATPAQVLTRIAVPAPAVALSSVSTQVPAPVPALAHIATPALAPLSVSITTSASAPTAAIKGALAQANMPAPLLMQAKAQTAHEYWSVKVATFSPSGAARAALHARKLALAQEAEARQRRRPGKSTIDNKASTTGLSEKRDQSAASTRRGRTMSPPGKAKAKMIAKGFELGVEGGKPASGSRSLSAPARRPSPSATPSRGLPLKPARISSQPQSIRTSPPSLIYNSGIAQVASRLEELARELAAQKALMAAAVPASSSSAVEVIEVTSSNSSRSPPKALVRRNERDGHARHALHISLSSPAGSTTTSPSPASATSAKRILVGSGPAQLTASRDLLATLEKQQRELEQLRRAVSTTSNGATDSKQPMARSITGSVGVGLLLQRTPSALNNSDPPLTSDTLLATDRKAQIHAAFSELRNTSQALVEADDREAGVLTTKIDKEEEDELPAWLQENQIDGNARDNSSSSDDGSDDGPSPALLARKAAAARQREMRQHAHQEKTSGQNMNPVVLQGAASSGGSLFQRRTNTLHAGVDLDLRHDAIGVQKVTAAELNELKRQDALVEARLQQEERAKALAKLEAMAIAQINAAALEAHEKSGRDSPAASLNSDNNYGLDDMPEWASDMQQEKQQKLLAQQKLERAEKEAREKIELAHAEATAARTPAALYAEELQPSAFTEDAILSAHAKYMQQVTKVEAKLAAVINSSATGAKIQLSSVLSLLPVTVTSNSPAADVNAETNPVLLNDPSLSFLKREINAAQEHCMIMRHKQDMIQRSETINKFTGFAQTSEGQSLGLLQLTVLSARDLPGKTRLTKAAAAAGVDPYTEAELILPESARSTLCRAFLSCDSEASEGTAAAAWATLQETVRQAKSGNDRYTQRTTALSSTLYPEWREQLIFAPVSTLEQVVRLKVQSSTHAYTDDVVLAECVLPLRLLRDQRAHRFTLSLSRHEIGPLDPIASAASYGTVRPLSPSQRASAGVAVTGSTGTGNRHLPESCVLRIDAKLAYCKADLQKARLQEAEEKLAALQSIFDKVNSLPAATIIPSTSHAQGFSAAERRGGVRSRFKYSYAGYGSEPPTHSTAQVAASTADGNTDVRGRNRLQLLGVRELLQREHSKDERGRSSDRVQSSAFVRSSSAPVTRLAKTPDGRSSDVRNRSRASSGTPSSAKLRHSFGTSESNPSPLRSEIRASRVRNISTRVGSDILGSGSGLSAVRPRHTPTERTGFGSASPTGRQVPTRVNGKSSRRQMVPPSYVSPAAGRIVSRGESQDRKAITPPQQRSQPRSVLDQSSRSVSASRSGTATGDKSRLKSSQVRSQSAERASTKTMSHTPARAVSKMPSSVSKQHTTTDALTPSTLVVTRARQAWSVIRKLGADSSVSAAPDSAATLARTQAQELEDMNAAEEEADVIIARAKARAQTQLVVTSIEKKSDGDATGSITPQRILQEALRLEMAAAEEAARKHAAEMAFRRTFRGAYVVHKVKAEGTVNKGKATTPVFGATSRRF